MRLSELQIKDVINVFDGKKVGNIIDAKINSSDGKMMKLIVEPNKMFRRFSLNKDELEIVWDQIVKIGDDVILVNIEFK